MRQLIVDTETTGLNPRNGDRIIEFAALEMLDRQLTGKYIHFYINPQCSISPDAAKVHGISAEMLQDKPIFSQLMPQILDFITDSQLIIHNAKFDLDFLNYQLNLHDQVNVETITHGVVDTLLLARRKFPGAKNSLDALCDRFKINRSNRGYHGALIDCELLALVYLALTREQISLLDDTQDRGRKIDNINFDLLELQANSVRTTLPTKSELEAHTKFLMQHNIKSW